MIRSRARELAFKNIYQHLISKDDAATIMSMYQHDDLFLTSLTYGVIDHKDELDSLIISNLKDNWTIDRLHYTDHAILLLATFELKHTDVERQIIINEAIILAKKYCDDDIYKFINGVLDNIV